MQAVIALAVQPGGFTASQLATDMAKRARPFAGSRSTVSKFSRISVMARTEWVSENGV